jgi:hypothetical protein
MMGYGNLIAWSAVMRSIKLPNEWTAYVIIETSALNRAVETVIF